MGDRLIVRILPSHKKALRRLAELEGEPVSVTLRRLIRAEAERKGVWPQTEHTEGEAENDRGQG